MNPPNPASPQVSPLETMRDEDLKNLVAEYPDFPKPGILFRDLSPILADPQAMHYLIERFAQSLAPYQPQFIAGIESRGFLFSTLLAHRFSCGSLMVRKPGKLPGKLHRQSYELEYGHSELTLSTEAPIANKRVVIVDDLLATGGTIVATQKLLQQSQAQPVAAATLMELPALNGRASIEIPVISLLRFEESLED